MDHGLGHHVIVRDTTRHLHASLLAESDDFIGPCRINIALVDHHQRLYSKMTRGSQHPFQIMDARHSRLRDQEGQVSPRTGRNHRTTDAWRSVNDDQFPFLIQSQQSPLLLDHRHQLAGVLLAGKEMGVKQRTIPRIGTVPLSGQWFFHRDRFNRALVEAGGAPLTTQRIDPVTFADNDGFEATYFSTPPTGSTHLLIYDGELSRPELMVLQPLWA